MEKDNQNEGKLNDQGKKLFTPGPLCVTPTVRAAMDRDLGSRDAEFIGIVKTVRQELLRVAGLASSDFTTLVLQGSGTFAVEAVLQSTSNSKSKALILSSGAYGRRMSEICQKARIQHEIVHFPENERICLEKAEEILSSEKWGLVAAVHCETTSGALIQIHELGNIVRAKCPSATYVVDAMSSFGGVKSNFTNVDFLISSANKCLQGVPGVAFVICKLDKLKQCQGRSTSLSLDLYEQWKGLEEQGQFRFTPPTHVILGLNQALKELGLEGGVEARAKRYKRNSDIIKQSLRSLGFLTFVSDEQDGHIITSFKYPNHPNFNFAEFYNRLSNKGQLIYPGKVTSANCFRIGNIGNLFPEDMEHLVSCIQQTLEEMDVPVPVSC